MASHQKNCIFFIVFTSCLISSISGNLVCEDLPMDLCAFSVSSSGSRCVLERRIMTNGDIDHECQTSQVGAEEYSEWVETDECVQSCGLDRSSIGISSDSLVERGFAKALCSPSCQNNCPNVVDLFTNLAAGEGVPLKHMCEEAMSGGALRRQMMGEVSFASVSSNTLDAWGQSAAAASPTTSQSLVGTATPPALAPATAVF